VTSTTPRARPGTPEPASRGAGLAGPAARRPGTDLREDRVDALPDGPLTAPVDPPSGAPADPADLAAGGSVTAADPTPVVLAIDGGNSKTDVALVSADGLVLASARGPGSCPQQVGLARCVQILAELVARTAEQAGIPLGGEPLVEHTAAYLAGADLPVEEARLQQAVHARGWGRHTEVANDTFALLRAGTTSPYGVAVVCGAGINCVGVGPDGSIARFPSLGRISGDWGGGQYLGEEALWLAARSEDGRGVRTGLQETVPAHFGMVRVADVTEAVHFDRIPEDRLGELTPVLFATAAAGDEAAGAIVDRLAEEISVMALVALRQLDLLDTETDVVLGGGVLVARDPVLMSGIADRLAAGAPRAVIRVTTVPPIVGAALLGLDRYGLAPGVEQRLREAFARA
jgi:N-acetylglucosamine kinase-like BadF-type ATPase